SAALGAAVAAWSVAAGLFVAVATAWLRAGRASRRSVVREIERTNPELRNLLVTAEEISTGALNVKPHVAERVVRDATDAARAVEIGRRLPVGRLLWFAGAAVVAWTAAFALHIRSGRVAVSPASPPAASPRLAAANGGVLHVSVAVQPPDYTGSPSVTLNDPLQVQAIQGSRLTFSATARRAQLTAEANGRHRAIGRSGAGRFEWSEVMTRSGYVAVGAEDGASRMLPIDVIPDALPAVQISAPGRDLIYAAGNPVVSFAIHATD